MKELVYVLIFNIILYKEIDQHGHKKNHILYHKNIISCSYDFCTLALHNWNVGLCCI